MTEPTADPARAQDGAAGQPADAAPARRARLLGVDAARGLALAGMVVVHVTPGTPDDEPVPLGDVLASGRASALFAVLAGVGLALASGGARPYRGRRLAAARRSVAARAGVVAAIGLTVGGVPTPAAVILAYYGLLFLVAVPVLGWGPRRLAASAAVSVVAAPVVSHLVRRAHPRGPGPNVSWADLLLAPGDLARTLLVDGYYPVLTWTAYLLLGLAVGRLPLGHAAVAARVAAGGAVLAVTGLAVGALTVALAGGAGALGATTGETADAVRHRLTTSSYGTSPTRSWWWLGTAGRHSGTGPDLLHTGGTALLALGLLLLLAGAAARSPWLRRLLAPLVAVGATTLTLYTVHVLLLGAAADTPGVHDLSTGAQVVGHLAVALAVATVVGAPRRRGPLEAFAAMAGRAAAGDAAAADAGPGSVPPPDPSSPG